MTEDDTNGLAGILFRVKQDRIHKALVGFHRKIPVQQIDYRSSTPESRETNLMGSTSLRAFFSSRLARHGSDANDFVWGERAQSI